MDIKETKLVKNTLIFALGTFGSRVLNFLIVPVYSYYINAENFGNYDLVVTSITVLTPIISLQITDGAYRWLVDDMSNKAVVISSTIKLVIMNLFVASVFLLVIYNKGITIPYVFATWMYGVSIILYNVLQQIVRGLGKNFLYSLGGILYTIIQLTTNLIGLIIFDMGVEVLLYSSSIAAGICCIIFLFKIHAFNIIKTRINKIVLYEMIIYSLPLIPNVICWWVVNYIDKYMVRIYLGPSANGIYAMASKFPMIITMATSIFYMAWQESAIKEYNTPSRDNFFSAVFKKYTKLLFSSVIVIIPFIRAFVELGMDTEYKSVWMYTGLLMIGCAFSALCSFLGIGYSISKDTNRALFTTMFAAITNGLLNMLLMKRYGIQVASLSTFLSYLLLFVIRIVDCKKYFCISIKWIELFILFLLSLLVLRLSFILSLKGCIVLVIGLLAIWIAVNSDLFKDIKLRQMIE